jgi:hypothetical protein
VLGGTLGADLTVEEGKRSAALAMLSALSTLSAAAGGLSNVRGMVTALGWTYDLLLEY